MHLGEHDPETGAAFLKELDCHIGPSTHLLLLGDLFEAWPGDDQQDTVATLLLTRLKELADRGVKVAVMRGNRDFLLDVPLPPNASPANDAGDSADAGNHPAPSFSAQTNADLLADECVLTIGEHRYLLMHGDTLCTDDTEYQAFRETCRQDAWQQSFLAHPLAQRVAQAQAYRQASKENFRQRMDREETIVDVSQQAVDTAMDRAECNVLIHGHTHRPNHHRWQFNAGARQRIVLPDWHAAQHGAARGGFLRLTARGVESVAL
jgi:UDP-2,3-diacylglucosamine hydrolase